MARRLKVSVCTSGLRVWVCSRLVRPTSRADAEPTSADAPAPAFPRESVLTPTPLSPSLFPRLLYTPDCSRRPDRLDEVRHISQDLFSSRELTRPSFLLAQTSSASSPRLEHDDMLSFSSCCNLRRSCSLHARDRSEARGYPAMQARPASLFAIAPPFLGVSVTRKWRCPCCQRCPCRIQRWPSLYSSFPLA